MKKFVSFLLALVMLISLPSTAFAVEPGENTFPGSNNTVSGTINVLTVTDSYIEYTEERDDGHYLIKETITGNNITSKIYKIDNTDNIFVAQIDSVILDGKVCSTETLSSGVTTTYEFMANIIPDGIDYLDPQLVPNGDYIRTEYYGISLVGKKVTIAIAAGAIVAVLAYVDLPKAIKIVSTAISAGGAAGVQYLPDYLYVKSDIYKSFKATYRKFIDSYYLDSARSQYIGQWTFVKQWANW